MNDKEFSKDVTTQKQAKDLRMEESITVAGISWSKFAEDGEGNAYMLADENIGYMGFGSNNGWEDILIRQKLHFGENNDWRESPIRKKLNEKLYRQIIMELGTHTVVPIETDLFSHDGLRDYGKCEDMVSLLTYDLYRNNRENIKKFGECWWLSTPDSTPSGCGSSNVQCVGLNGGVSSDWCDYLRIVRPFFILKSDTILNVERG